MTVSEVVKLIAPLRTRVFNMVARGVVRWVVDNGGVQVLQLGVLAGETRDRLERFQEYGFSSHPHAGAEAVVLFVDGRRDHGLVVAVDDRRYRMKSLAPGEVALYTDEGDHVLLKRGRVVEVKAGTKLAVDAPAIDLGGGTMQPAALATALRAELDAIWAKLVALGTHNHGPSPANPPSTGAVTKAEEAIASSSVRVKT